MAAMISDLVDWTRLQAGQWQMQPEALRLPALVRKIAGRVGGPEASPRVRVETHGRVPSVNADPLLLERGLRNLISNALKYSPEGTPVLVVVEGRPGKRPSR